MKACITEDTVKQWPFRRSYDFAGGSVKLTLGTRTLIMGILNMTPDSFSDGGRYNEVEAAVRHAEQMVADGADIIDIGGESTRPGFEPVPVEEELKRVIPVIKAIRAALPNIPLSIDTYKAETADQALRAGAHIINDIWGLKGEARMAEVAAAHRCPVIISHNRHTRDYSDLITDVVVDLRESIKIARNAGVSEELIWLDPGIGFAKTYEDNLALMSKLDQVVAEGYPVLLGTSRKKFIRDVLQLNANEITFGTAATTALGIMQGCQIVRVHDIRENKQTALMSDAIVYPRAKSI
ncbi:dihydropteroate synthase [Paenibacillus sp. BC26]|uniref:dihydropteroate synthase n=1 Tax=Paenibacillus sp. BC26 TaxID=1881032 RepID=UPI0008E3EF95|nr:dihydropteroate synthase [Paenibacillus sp. BC26]SFT28427.1 Dihydropteroate synthase [Paenibacillus sp. BC26]